MPPEVVSTTVNVKIVRLPSKPIVMSVGVVRAPLPEPPGLLGTLHNDLTASALACGQAHQRAVQMTTENESSQREWISPARPRALGRPRPANRILRGEGRGGVGNGLG